MLVVEELVGVLEVVELLVGTLLVVELLGTLLVEVGVLVEELLGTLLVDAGALVEELTGCEVDEVFALVVLPVDELLLTLLVELLDVAGAVVELSVLVLDSLSEAGFETLLSVFSASLLEPPPPKENSQAVVVIASKVRTLNKTCLFFIKIPRYNNFTLVEL